MITRKGGSGGDMSDGFIRLRGLPFESTKADIATFFNGFEIAPYGITITMDQDGRPSGEAYVEFASLEAREQAMIKHKEKIRHRYIEIFKCTKQDVKYVTQSNQFGGVFSQSMGFRPGPYDRPGMGFSGRGSRGGGMMGMSMGGGMNMSNGSSGGFGGSTGNRGG